jgi:SAM-dependent methyltransferase
VTTDPPAPGDAALSPERIQGRIGPAAYAVWRGTQLGIITEAIEQRLVLDLAGELRGRRVLDVGCGDGTLACLMAARSAQAFGVDPDAAMLGAARQRAASAKLAVGFFAGRIERLALADETFDLVVAVTVLCFVRDAAQGVREMSRILKPGGRLIVGELGRWSSWAALRRVRGLLGSKTWAAATFRTAGELRALVEQAGPAVETVRGAVYYPPIGALARALSPIDPWLARWTTLGAAFIAIAGTKPQPP